jgi:hypothetical protein
VRQRSDTRKGKTMKHKLSPSEQTRIDSGRCGEHGLHPCLMCAAAALNAPRLAEENERLRALLKDLMVECSQHIPEDSNCERLRVVCGQVRAALTGGCSCGQTDSNHTNDGCNLNRAALAGREEDSK